MQEESQGHWFQIILIYAVSIVAMMCISEAAPVIGAMAADVHAGSAIGFVMSLPALVTVLCALIIGWIVDRSGDRPVLLAGLAILIVGDLGSISTHVLRTLLFWRVVGGVGYVCVAVAAVTMVARTTVGQRRTAALALWSSVIPAGFIAAFLLAAILTRPGHWRSIFVAHIVLSAAALVVSALALPRPVRQTSVSTRLTGLTQVLRTPFPYALGASFAFNACLQTGLIASFAPLVSMRLGIPAREVDPFSILAMLFNIAGALAVGRLLNRGVRAWIIGATAMVLCGVAGLLIALAPLTLFSAIVLDCIVLLGCGLMVGLWALLPAVAPSPQTIGATSGLITQITLLGVLLGPPAAFICLKADGVQGIAFFVVAVLVGCLLGLPVWLRGALRRAVPFTAASPMVGRP